MSSKAARLEAQVGRNVAESLGATPRPTPRIADTPQGPPRERVRADAEAFRIPLSLIDPDPSQPRKAFDEAKLGELAASLTAQGQLQPCAVSHGDSPGRFILLCGERRFRAAALAGLPDLLCRVDDRPPADRLAAQLVENLQRDEMNPIELSDGLARLKGDHAWSSRDIAAKLGLSQSTVARSLALAGLADGVRDRVRDGRLAPSSAAILGRIGSPNVQEELARTVVTRGLSRDQVEDLVEDFLRPRPAPVSHGDSAPAEVSHGDSAPAPAEVSHGDSAPAPAGPPPTTPTPPSHGDSAPGALVAAPGRSGGVPPAAAKPGAAADAIASETRAVIRIGGVAIGSGRHLIVGGRDQWAVAVGDTHGSMVGLLDMERALTLALAEVKAARRDERARGKDRRRP